MARPIPQKKSKSKFPAKPIVRKKVAKKLPTVPVKWHGWMVCGFDTSMSSIAGAAFAYDHTLKKYLGPEFVIRRWSKEDHYFDRLKQASKSHELVLDLQATLHISFPVEDIYIAQEEPIPLGMLKGKSVSGFAKQQAEVSGAFLGGLLRYGFQNIFQINNMRWRKPIADDLGITTHPSKWKDPDLCEEFNCAPANTGKFRAKQWAMMNPGYAWMHSFSEEVPDFPDIIESSKLGKIPRPDGSTAKAVQCDDRYEALAMAWSLYLEMSEAGNLDKST
jgi:hypothetical protein